MTRAACTLGIVLALGVRGASAAEEGAPPQAVADSLASPAVAPRTAAAPGPAVPAPRRSAPFRVLLRSALVPGWGQVYNGKLIKAAAVIAGEGYLVYRANDEFRKENDAIDRLSLALGLPEGSEREIAIARASEDRRVHKNLKVTFIWWAIAAHLLQMADAYVDAHLATFDADFGPDDSVTRTGSAPELAVRLTARF